MCDVFGGTLPGMEMRTFDSFRDLFKLPGWQELIDAYAAESGNADLGDACPKASVYDSFDCAGLLRSIAVLDQGRVVGVLVMLLQDHPHFSKPVAHVDSIFLDKAHRRGAAGLRLVRRALDVARESGAAGCYFSAPEGSRLSRLFELLFKPTDRIFWASCEVTNGH